MKKQLLALSFLYLWPQSSLCNTKVSARFDCMHNATTSKGSTQSCLNVSGLKLRYTQTLQPDTAFAFTINPFGRPAATLDRLPGSIDTPLPKLSDSELGIISHYALTWKYRNNLDLSLKSHYGPTYFEPIHNLALGSRFFYTGWAQAALTSRYQLRNLGGLVIEFILGNGEGEPVRNLDTQQYGGIRLEYNVDKDLEVLAGASIDLNTMGSEAFKWTYERDEPDGQGFSVQRFGLSIRAHNGLGQIPGLTVALNALQTNAKDLNKEEAAVIADYDHTAYASLTNLSLYELLVEDPEEKLAAQVLTTVFDISIRYMILATHFISLNHEARTIKTPDIDFFTANDGGKFEKIEQTGSTLGLGIQITDQLNMTVEYRTEAYNKVYEIFHYQASNDQKKKSTDLFNARISYNW